ncbi:hypothetical protein [Candidatus Phytoplasma prunorum]|uniref:hypothetical protein n=1 Tax=Candidatus Phytoplasma prunorum TaxID=47565 RepID=UPI002FEF67D9
MVTPLDVLQSWVSLKSTFTFIMITMTVLGLIFYTRKTFVNHQQASSNTPHWGGYGLILLIILLILSGLYLGFFYESEPSTKYAQQLIPQIDEALAKYDDTINNYHGLKKDWETDLKAVEAELKELLKQQDLTQTEKARIETTLNDKATEIANIKKDFQDTTANITIFKGKLLNLTTEKADKEAEIVKTQTELSQTKNEDDKKRLRVKLDKLNEEASEIIQQMSDIRVKIKHLEIDQKTCQERLTMVETMKNDIEKDFKFLNQQEQELLNKIKDVETRKAEIQTSINEIDEQIKKVEARKEIIKIMRDAAMAALSAASDYDKKNSFNFTNLITMIDNTIGEALQFKRGIFAWKEIKDLRNEYFGKETAQQYQDRKNKEYAEELEKHLGKAKILFLNPDNTMKFIDQTVFNTINKQLDWALIDLKIEVEEHQKRRNDYLKQQKESNLSAEFRDEIKTNTLSKDDSKKTFTSIIYEYQNLTEELNKKLEKVQDLGKLPKDYKNREEKLFALEESINEIKTELKQKNPSYARAQQRLQDARNAKFYQPIINK